MSASGADGAAAAAVEMLSPRHGAAGIDPEAAHEDAESKEGYLLQASTGVNLKRLWEYEKVFVQLKKGAMRIYDSSTSRHGFDGIVKARRFLDVTPEMIVAYRYEARAVGGHRAGQSFISVTPSHGAEILFRVPVARFEGDASRIDSLEAVDVAAHWLRAFEDHGATLLRGTFGSASDSAATPASAPAPAPGGAAVAQVAGDADLLGDVDRAWLEERAKLEGVAGIDMSDALRAEAEDEEYAEAAREPVRCAVM